MDHDRKNWRRDHPFGFVAKPVRTDKGTVDLRTWDCAIPGKEKTLWEGGQFRLQIVFPEGMSLVPDPPPFLPCLPRLHHHQQALTRNQNTPPNPPNANSFPLSSTQTSTPVAQSVSQSLTKKKVGDPLSRSRRSCWEYRVF